MRKKLFIACIALFMVTSFQSFKPIANPKSLPAFKSHLKLPFDLKKFTAVSVYKVATSSGSVSLQVKFSVEYQDGAIYSIKVYNNSSCAEYEYVGYTGYIWYHLGHYEAVNLDIDLDGNGTHVTIDGQLNVGVPPCEAE